MTNPYSGLEDHCFWARAMTSVAPGHVDPVVNPPRILPHEKIASMGSCFAQHLVKHIQRAGLSHLDTELPPPGMDIELARQKSFGMYSARFGNVYTARQALQLFDRAFGAFTPAEDSWRRGDVLVDPFRPQIQPEGFASLVELREDVRKHLTCVAAMFEQADWIIFTLGLTEAWRSSGDGAVFPIAPGVAGGKYDSSLHEFVNFSAWEVTSDLVELHGRIKSVNPTAKILLTVSPVPLVATYEPRHVWTSTTASKAALRVACDDLERRFDDVFYFPSYEIITSPAAGGRYFDDDLRSVTQVGVDHVMRIFLQSHCASQVRRHRPTREILDVQTIPDVICDEEAIQQIVKDSGFGK